MTNKKIPVVSFIFFLMVAVSVSSFSTTCLPHTTLQSNRASFSTWKLFSAMERLHDPSTNAYGRVEHVYSLSEIDRITQKIIEDEWAALGSVIAETMLETILEVGDDVLTQRGWVERMSVTNKIAEEVSTGVHNALHQIRNDPTSGNTLFDQGGSHLSLLQTLLRHQLGTIIGLDDNKQFDIDSRNLSLLCESIVNDAIDSHVGKQTSGPFFNLSTEMNNRIRNRRRELMLKHSTRGYESVKDVEDDIEESRMEWMRNMLGAGATQHYEFGEVTTKVGNEHSHEIDRRMRKERRTSILNALTLRGLMP